tara:strand:- start:154 stop:555 length:402 start_codon:yes stop_codon:yes gene_type:complete
MASILKVDTITGVATAGSIAITGEGNSTTTNLQQGLAKAWCHYEGDETSDILKDSLNIASITDLAAGRHSVTYTNNMNNAFYASSACGSTQRRGHTDTNSHATTGVTFEYEAGGGTTFTDAAQNQHIIMGDLA